MAVEHSCEHCGTLFFGRSDARFCGDTCRWRHHAAHRKPQTDEEMAKREKDPAAQARGRSNRRKGAVAEREVCHIIRDITFDEVNRNLSQTRDAGGDVVWGPFYLEVKYQRTIAMPAWQLQAVQSARQDGRGLVPAVVYRKPNEPFWISLPFADFLNLFATLREAARLGTQPSSVPPPATTPPGDATASLRASQEPPAP